MGLESRLITTMGWSEVTLSRHLPAPSPSAPLRSRSASPLVDSDSNSCALTVRAPARGHRELHRGARRLALVVDALDAHLGALRPAVDEAQAA